VRHHHGEHRAHEELEGSCVGAVVGAIDPVADRDPTVGERCRGKRAERRPDHDSPAARHREHRDDHRSEDEIKLLLDAERPVVLKRRRGGEEVGVRTSRPEEPPVGDVGDRGEAVDAEGARRPGVVQRRGHRGRDDQTRERGGEEPPDPARVEAPQRDSCRGAPFREEQTGDEVTREREERGDAEEPAAQAPVVEREHRAASRAASRSAAVPSIVPGHRRANSRARARAAWRGVSPLRAERFQSVRSAGVEPTTF
jgi:hypothetical protein